MARICFVCGKGPKVANLVSHANNKVKRWVYPNTHTMRFTLKGSSSDKVVRDRVCTKCVKSKKVTRVL